MHTFLSHTLELKGTNYEIGYQLGKFAGKNPSVESPQICANHGLNAKNQKDALALFDTWCPGLTEETNGFADALQVNPQEVTFYAMTYLLPRCSHMALLPSITQDHKPLIARNYEFSPEAEDFTLIKTCVSGKYAHMGTSVLYFGRDDGFNEHGLAVTMSSCGFPVGSLPYMRAPKKKGLQFWAVTRALLENCKNTAEALSYLKNMPIAYNLNLILLDKLGNAALVETLDGAYAVQQIDADSSTQFLCATNHPVLPEIIPHEPKAFLHSAQRYHWIKSQLEHSPLVSAEKLKHMLLSNYPDGLCCHYFEEFFGTTKSMVLSPADGTIDLCWGGQEENGWRTYDINQPLENTTRQIHLAFEKADPIIYGYQPIK